MPAAGTIAKWGAGFFFIFMIAMIGLYNAGFYRFIAFVCIHAGKAGQHQYIKAEYKSKEFHCANVAV
jgi:hypothetical protein